MASKTALITGITGQDGAYLSALLVERGYRVVGTSRQAQADMSRLAALSVADSVTVISGDQCDPSWLAPVVATWKPDEIYNLSSQNSVAASITAPHETLSYNINSLLTLLEVLRIHHPAAKLFQASSSEMYGPETAMPITETSPLHPTNPYGASKAAGHLLVQTYRTQYGMFVVSGILFNHESPLRAPQSFIQTLIRTAVRIKYGAQEYVYLGDPTNERDYGSAPHYVDAMWRSLQAEVPSDYVIASGAPIAIKRIAEYVLTQCQVSLDRIRTDPALSRRPNVPVMFGDSTRACHTLGWCYDRSFFEVLDTMIAAEFARHA